LVIISVKKSTNTQKAENLLKDGRTLEELVDQELEKVENSKPPVSVVDEQDWKEVSRVLADYLIDEPNETELEELEKHGARLLLSPDQKRFRVGVALDLADAMGIDMSRDQLIQLFASIEGTHVYSKGIDDIEDRDSERNGYPTLHNYMEQYFNEQGVPEEKAEQLGESFALNYFLAIKSRNYKMISELNPAEFGETEEEGHQIKYEIAEEFRRALENSEAGLTYGQNLDLSGSVIGYDGFQPNYMGGDKDVIQHLSKANMGKTAELFALIGTYLEKLSEEYSGDELEEWGYNAGQAFQIWDDTLDIKLERNSDLEENNYSFTIYIAERYLHTHPNERKNELGRELSNLLRTDNPFDYELERANQIIAEETPAVEASRNQAKYLVEQANDYLDDIDVFSQKEPVMKVKGMTEELGYRREK